MRHYATSCAKLGNGGQKKNRKNSSHVLIGKPTHYYHLPVSEQENGEQETWVKSTEGSMAVEYSLYVTEHSLWRTFLLSCVAVEYSPYITEDPLGVEWLVYIARARSLIVPSPDRETSTLLPPLIQRITSLCYQSCQASRR